MKKRVHVSQCTGADILAEDIINSYGATVLAGGAVINEYIIERLKELKIEYICIVPEKRAEQPFYVTYQAFEKKYEHCVEEMKQLTLELIKGKKTDYSVVRKISNSVIAANAEPDLIIKCLGKIRDTDDYTYFHCVNVSFYAMLLSGWLNLARDDIRTVVQAALLHDIGKAKVSAELLNKKEKLSVKEFNEIKKHAIYGYKLVKDSFQISEEIKDVILMHHERENKSGYPLNAGGDDLSIYTKIVAVADVYDAMTSNRPYKRALTPFDAFEELLTVCRGRLDMHIVNTLLNNLSRYYVGSKVLLSNGKTGNVAYIPPHCMGKPLIDTGSGFLDLSREKEVSINAMV